MQTKQVTVGGVKYNVAQASAVKQKKLMLLVGPRLALNSATSGTEQIHIPMVKGVLMSESETKFDEIADIVLYKTVKNGGDKLVTIDDFSNAMNDYLTLIAEAVKVNLNDFFNWLDTENEKTRTGTKTPA